MIVMTKECRSRLDLWELPLTVAMKWVLRRLRVDSGIQMDTG